MKFSFERKIIAGFCAALLLLLLVGAAALWNARRLNASHLLVDHTHQILHHLEQVLTDELSMQTSTREFVLTGSDDVLLPYEQGRRHLAEGMRELHRLLSDNPAQQQRLAEVEVLTNQAVVVMGGRIAARKTRGLESARDTSGFLKGQGAVAAVRQAVQVMEDEERRSLRTRLSGAQAAIQANLMTIAITAGLAAGLGVAMAGIALRNFRLRRRTEETLRLFNEQLEGRVRERTTELESVNRELKQEITERKRAENVMRQSEARMREAQKQARLGNWELDLLTQKGAWSEEIFRLHGRDPALGPPTFAGFIERVHPEDRDGLLRAHAAAIETNVPMVHEYRIVRPDGETRWVLARTEGFRDKSGRLVRRAGTEQDITERVIAEEAVHHSERRFRALIEHSADGISLIDAEHNLLYVSPAVSAIEGYTAEELASRNSLENTHPDDIPAVHEAVRQLRLKPSTPIPVLWRQRHKNGGWIWLEGVATNLLHDPAVRAIVTNYRDVTERKHIEEIRARLVAIVESSGDAIVSATLDGTITSWNHGAEKIFGYAAADAIGQPLKILIPLEHRASEPKLLRQISRHETISHFETVCLTRDGRRIDVSVSLSPITDENGRIVGISKIARDITAHQQAQQEIRQLNQGLEQRVARRTAQLEAVNRELEAFSYSVSHDLRAPLRHIDGFAGLLSKHAGASLDEKGRRYLTTISDAARKMGRLIDDLLAFSRMGRAAMTLVEVDHGALVAAVIREGRFDGGAKAIEWVVGELPPVSADPAMLRQVWINLIDNAFKYSGPSAHPRIEIGSVPSAQTPEVGVQGEQVFFVRDNGVGFDMNYVDKLFGVFQRLHSAAEFEGTGIGLANVLRIVTRHGGRAWAESRLGEGATFYFSLPVPTAPPPPP